MKPTLHNLSRVLAIGLIAAGIAVMAPFGYYWFQNHQVAAQTQPIIIHKVALKPSAITGRPVEINIASMNIDLKVIDGTYNKESGAWTLTLDKAQYATPSVQPNDQEGNTLIYGHYRPEVFAYLHHIVPGAKAVISTDNGYAFTYTYQTTQTMDPTDTSIFSYQGRPRLTLQTCSGAYMQNRQMYYFSFDGVTKT